jgi:hypothetical protein
LFVLRLRTGNDLRDQADLASARSVTTGSWFSDCIGASGLLVVVGSQGSSSAKSELSLLAERSGTSATSPGRGVATLGLGAPAVPHAPPYMASAPRRRGSGPRTSTASSRPALIPSSLPPPTPIVIQLQPAPPQHARGGGSSPQQFYRAGELRPRGSTLIGFPLPFQVSDFFPTNSCALCHGPVLEG